MNYQHFDFVVENMTEAQAVSLMGIILASMDAMGLSLGGGYHQTSDEDYPEASDDQEDA